MRPSVVAVCAALAVPVLLPAQTQGVQHGVRPPRLVIRNATVVDGNGTPARGPFDIVIEGTTITALVALDPVALQRGGEARRPEGDLQIDATGKFVLPGLVNAHAHLQSNRSGHSLGGYDYVTKLWLANGITSVREVGPESDTGIVRLREESARGAIVAPRLFAYPMFGQRPTPRTTEEARARIRHFKQIGADGVKFTGVERAQMEAARDGAHKVGLRVAHHVGVEETNVWDDIRFGTTSIEHWYGIPDAAILDLRQHFPSDYNYLDETDRFRWAGRLWREADPARLDSVLTAMVKANVAWVPTMDIYEASRDLQRAQTQPWFADYLHPSLEWYFRPDPANHGSYFIGWSTTDEVYWKENYRIWMAALRDFERKGGLIGCGDDAGFIYQMYGYGLIREMELHAEAGFHPLKIIEHCTGNGAKILGQETRIGRVRAGWLADVIVVDGNPLEDIKVLYAGGTTALRDGKEVRTNGVEWVIKDGIPYNGPQLLREVKAIVDSAKAAR
jgi:cytosine/adenosine deaminase-related metal-dependent hydrolase